MKKEGGLTEWDQVTDRGSRPSVTKRLKCCHASKLYELIVDVMKTVSIRYAQDDGGGCEVDVNNRKF